MRGAIRLRRNQRSASARARPDAGKMIGSSAQGRGRRAIWRWTSHGDAGATNTSGVCSSTRAVSGAGTRAGSAATVTSTRPSASISSASTA